MRKCLRKILCLLLVIVMISGLPGIINPSFGAYDASAAEPDSWNVPDKWYMDAQNGVVELDNTVSHTGARSVKMTGTGHVGQSVVLFQPWVEQSQVYEYIFSIWYKTSGGYNGTPRISVLFTNKWGTPFKDEGGAYERYIYGETGDHDWIELSGKIDLPKGSSKPLVQFESEGTVGTIWFDDAKLTVIDSSRNVIINPGFETKFAQISDVEFFGKMNLDLPGMEGMKAAVGKGDYTAARSEYLEYYSTRTTPIYDTPMDGDMPEPAADYDRYQADLAADHYWNLIYGYDKQLYLGPDISWSDFPPGYDQSWYGYKTMIRGLSSTMEDSTIALNMFLDSTVNGKFPDSGMYGNHGFIRGTGGEISYSQSGDALKLNNTYIRVEDSDSLDITDQLTIEGWYKFDGEVSDSFLLHKNNAYSIKAADANGNPSASVYVDGEWRTVTSPDTVAADEWYHIAMTYSTGKKELRLYVNGILKEMDTLSGYESYALNASDSWTAIGCDSASAGFFFNGFIDELNVSNTVKNVFVPSEIPTADVNTRLQFKFDSGSGTAVADTSSNSNNGIINGSGYSWSCAKYDGAFKTNGISTLQAADADTLDITRDLRVEGWFRSNGALTDSFVIQKDHAYGLKLSNSDGLPTVMVYIDGAWRSVSSTEAVDPNTWYHLGLIYSSNKKELRLYVNGALKSSLFLSDLVSYTINASSDPLIIGGGSEGSGPDFNGYIDQIRITSTADKYFGTLTSPFICAGLLDYAYWYTGDEKYAGELITEMLDFIKDNHYREQEFINDPLWTSNAYRNSTGQSCWNTLMTSSRLRNMNQHLYSVRKSASLTPDRFVAIMKSMYEHASDMRIRTSPTGNDAIVTSSYGYEFAVMHPEFSESAEWREFFMNRLNGFLETIVYPDGVEDELAPGYHVYVLQSYAGSLALAKLNGYSILPSFEEKMEKMYEFTMGMAKPDGTMPQFSDTDNGYLRYEIYRGGRIFDRDDMRYVGSGGIEGTVPDHTSAGYNYGGFYFMRSGWGSDDNYLAFDAGPLGTAHEHQDKLTFELFAYGKSLIADAGKLIYANADSDGGWRNYVYGSASHNLMLVDGMWQNRTYSPSAGAPVPITDATFITSEYFDYATGEYTDGYGEAKDKSVSQERTIFFVKPGYWILRDIAKVTSGSHTLDELFQYTPSVVTIDPQTLTAYSNNIGEANLRIIPVDGQDMTADVAAGQQPPDPIRGWVSPEYGEKYAAPQVKYTKTDVTSSTNFDFILYPTAPGTNPVVNATRLPVVREGITAGGDEASAIKVAVEGSSENDYIFLGEPDSGKISFGTAGEDEITTDAETALINRNASNNILKAFSMVNGTTLLDNGTRMIRILASTDNNYVTARYNGNTLEIITDVEPGTGNTGNAIRIYGNEGITEVTVNGQSMSFGTDNSYIVIGNQRFLSETVAEAVAAALDAIGSLPEVTELTLDDKARVVAARSLVNAALAAGAEYSDLFNLDKLKACESRIAYMESITATPEFVTIDGILDEYDWNLNRRLTIGEPADGSTSAVIGTLSDSKKLYIAVDVTDSNPVNTNNQYPFFDDSVEIFIDGNLASGQYDANTVQYIFRYDDDMVHRYTGNYSGTPGTTTEGIEHSMTRTAKGYTLEIAIPWTAFGLDSASTTEIGFTAAVNNAEADTTVQLTENDKGNWQDSTNWIILPLTGKLTIDGIISEPYWNMNNELMLRRAFYDDSLPVDGNMKAVFGTLADERFLYLAYDVTDSNVVNSGAAYPWEDDSIDIYIDGNLNKGLYDGNTVQYIFRWADQQIYRYTSSNSGSVTTIEGIRQAQIKTDSGYAMEIAIPWSALGIDPYSVTKIGFTSHVNNPDSNTTLKLTENANGNGNWKDSSGWMELPVSMLLNPPGNEVNDGLIITLPVLDNADDTALSEISAEEFEEALSGAMQGDDGKKKIIVDIPEIFGAQRYALQLPAALLTACDANTLVEIKTAIASMVITDNMINGTAAALVFKLTFETGDTEEINKGQEEKFGDRPVVAISAEIDGEPVAWENPDAPVTISIDYTLSEEELEKPEHIVVRYINENGNARPIPNGYYDPASGEVTFTVSYLGKFAVAFLRKI